MDLKILRLFSNLKDCDSSEVCVCVPIPPRVPSPKAVLQLIGFSQGCTPCPSSTRHGPHPSGDTLAQRRRETPEGEAVNAPGVWGPLCSPEALGTRPPGTPPCPPALPYAPSWGGAFLFSILFKKKKNQTQPHQHAILNSGAVIFIRNCLTFFLRRNNVGSR